MEMVHTTRGSATDDHKRIYPEYKKAYRELRKQIGALYRRIFKKSALLLGFGSLPVVLNGRWVFLPLELWDGFRMSYEPYVAKEIDRSLRPGGTFVDVGAHLGIWSIYAASIVGSRGVVISCEPSGAYEILARAASRYPAIRPFRIAIGSASGRQSFYTHGSCSYGSFFESVTEINAEFIPGVDIVEALVEVRRLDLALDEAGLMPDVIKIDVEGYELEVIRGAQETLEKGASVWIIEVHPRQLKLSGGTEEELFPLLGKHGYSTRVLHENPNSIYTILAEK